ncbi:TadE family protein [Streptomyces sp. NPDC057426]|uniref:TadE family protein n=1 Tax=Streptomyces sp. NPDC057426 TaxID=3346128 RepID=UPI0036D15438
MTPRHAAAGRRDELVGSWGATSGLAETVGLVGPAELARPPERVGPWGETSGLVGPAEMGRPTRPVGFWGETSGLVGPGDGLVGDEATQPVGRGHGLLGGGTTQPVRPGDGLGRGGTTQPVGPGDGLGEPGGTTMPVATRVPPVAAAEPSVPGDGRRDRGQVAVEYLGFLPILLLVGLAGIQLGIAAYAAQQAGTGARAAARAATHDEATIGPQEAGRAAMSDWIAERSVVSPSEGAGEFTATVRVRIPSVVPFWDGFGSVTRSATLPQPEEDE